MKRQTRSSTRAARIAAASVTPSPTKKHKAKHESSPPIIQRRTLFRDKDDSKVTREEVKQLIRSSIPNVPDNFSTATSDGWCLVDGLHHCMQASNGILKELIEEHGPPKYFLRYLQTGKTNTQGGSEDGYHSFRSLCRIVGSQQLAKSAANMKWERLLGVVGASTDDTTNLTPQAILSIAQNGCVEDDLRSPTGLSNAKVSCIIALSEAFEVGDLSDEILSSASDEEVSEKLQKIKGIGPWSVDMFLLFECHRQDMLPLGDLAVRKGTAKLWKKGKNAQKDKSLVESLHEPFAPYRSISSYYMYQLIDGKK